jgi:hypothetical protein
MPPVFNLKCIDRASVITILYALHSEFTAGRPEDAIVEKLE